MLKILVLGNEFIEGDSLAKKISEVLKKDFEIIEVKDSFQLIGLLNETNENEVVLLDVVKGFKNVQLIGIDELRNDSILSAHDFDAGYILKLIGKNFKIIGIPQKGDEEKIREGVKVLIQGTFKTLN